MSRRSSFLVSSFFVLALRAGAPPLASAQTPARVGPEIQVNVYTTGNQDEVDVAVLPNGGFVVVWQSESGQDGDGFGVFARRFGSTGLALASEFQISELTTDDQGYPSIAVDGDGDFVVAWFDVFLENGGGVVGRRFDSAGLPLTAEIVINSYGQGAQAGPSVASQPDGDFVVVWSSFGQDDDGWGVFGQRFDSSGALLASEFQVNTYTVESQLGATVALDADADFVVVWRSAGQDGDGQGVFARRFDSNGDAQAVEFQVSAATLGYQARPSIDSRNDGDFVVAFTSDRDGSGHAVFAQRFDSAGTAIATEFQVNTYTLTGQNKAAVAYDGDGDFVISFHSNPQDGNEYGMFARRFSSTGVPLGGEVQVNTYTQSFQSFGAVSSHTNGDFVVVWRSYGQDEATGTGVFAQRFLAAGVALDVDGNGAVGALTDGVLGLRYLFGFTGASLVSGVTGPGCARCDAAAIEPYLNGLGLVLDADDNKDLDELTDGVLILRFLFGFTGMTLTDDATAPDCVRCDASTILPYLQTLD